MTLILDTGPLVAVADRNDRMQGAVERLLRTESGELVVPATVAAEVDYLLGRRGGRPARLAFLEDVARGRFVLAGLDVSDVATILELERRYVDLDAGLTDLSIVVIAARFQTVRVATFDRHFRALRPLEGHSTFDVVPAD